MILPHNYQISAFLLMPGAVLSKKPWAVVVMMCFSAVQALVPFNMLYITLTVYVSNIQECRWFWEVIQYVYIHGEFSILSFVIGKKKKCMKGLFPLPYFFGICGGHQISSNSFPLKLFPWCGLGGTQQNRKVFCPC